jgi:hypothetical protein
MVLPEEMRESLRLRGRGVISATLAGGKVELEAVNDLPTKKVGRFLVIKSTGEEFNAVTALNESRRER